MPFLPGIAPSNCAATSTNLVAINDNGTGTHHKTLKSSQRELRIVHIVNNHVLYSLKMLMFDSQD
jgi:hypothetical protein